MPKAKAAAQPKVLQVEGATPKASKSFLAGQFAKPNADQSAYAADTTEKAVAGDSLKVLQSLAQELITESKNVEQCVRDLKAALERKAEIAEHKLPDMMEEHSLPKFEFYDRSTGRTLTIKLDSDKWRISMPPLKDDQGNPLPDNVVARKHVFAWLREIGNAGSIKKNMEVPLGLLSDESAENIVRVFKLEYQNLDPALTEKIEPATLTALCNRRLKDGKSVHESLQVKPVREAKVSNK